MSAGARRCHSSPGWRKGAQRDRERSFFWGGVVFLAFFVLSARYGGKRPSHPPNSLEMRYPEGILVPHEDGLQGGKKGAFSTPLEGMKGPSGLYWVCPYIRGKRPPPKPVVSLLLFL